jgi:hypothetical protein
MRMSAVKLCPMFTWRVCTLTLPVFEIEYNCVPVEEVQLSVLYSFLLKSQKHDTVQLWLINNLIQTVRIQ